MKLSNLLIGRLWMLLCLISLSCVLGCTCLGLKTDQKVSQLNQLDKQVSQAVLVFQTAKGHRLEAWQFIQGKWKMVMDAPANVGRNGIALVGDKKEGDGKTPSGIYPLRRAFGYLDQVATGLNYQKVGGEDLWIDDVKSSNYNQWVMAPTLANSFEKLKRDDDLYQYAVVIEYNTDPIVAGAGSAIFLHVWRGENIPTAGCVAISESKIKSLLKWLKRELNPVIVIESPTS